MKNFSIDRLAVVLLTAGSAFGQTGSFPGFTPGNLVVSRSVYSGDANTIVVGQTLPPVCPATADCGTTKATDNGAYPVNGSSNNVWNNDKVDGSFGITSPIFLDQISPAGTVINTLAIPGNVLATSFPSKSEVALNLSTDGTAITLMGYTAPLNAVDISNSNTPGAYDPTNPAGGSYFRAVAQIGANGAIQITNTNGYSGNNGRAAILANGQYYMAGNSNNGSGTPANVVAAGGVQIATPGQSAGTAAAQVGNFSITQVTNPATGMPYPADKLGKDNNFRGLTIFNNTLYVTKGSGGNGINTVYQVGDAGTLPTIASAATASITILPGFPTILAKDPAASNPFGIWFANANTLYVADEGTGVAADAATSNNAGLQKWTLISGTWKRAYVLQNGLNLGQQYSVNNYPASLNPATDGLRNITGKVNADGTATIWAITSTISTNGDQGADPNKLVSIADVIANTDPAVAAKEQFTTLRTAAAGEVLRGVSFTPATGATTMTYTPVIISSANPGATAIAPGSLATANGQGLGNSVSIVDAAGKTTAASLLYTSPTQINFQVPAGAASGTAQVIVSSGTANQAAAKVQIAALAPGVFTLNNAGLAAADVLTVAADGTRTYQNVYTTNSGGAIVANPIDLGPANGQVYLMIYGTGFQAAGAANVQVTAGGVDAPVLYAGPQGGFSGLDQINVQLPASLAGKGNVNLQVTVGRIPANPAQIAIK